MRPFELVREEDVSGCSGVGVVAHGAVMPSGRVFLEWLPGVTGAVSVGIYESVDAMLAIHGHQGRTHIRYR